jgi:lipopolysaccharide transport system permease protein
MVIDQTPLAWNLVAVPLLILVVLAITVGMSLLFSALNVYYRDFAYALPFLLQVWMYASPVVYSSSLIPEQWRLLYGLNPMVGVIDGFRWALLGGVMPVTSIIEAAMVGGVMLLVGAWVFNRVERGFADAV